MSSTPFISSDVDLLWSKDGSDIFSHSFQIYAEANHVDDATNAKPSNGANVVDPKVFDVIIILFS